MKRILFSVLCLFCAGTALYAQSDLQPLVNVKLGKTESITLKQLKARVDIYQRQSKTAAFTVEQKKEILDSMIDEKLVIQAAQKAGIAITDSQANQYFLESISSQVGKPVTEQQFAELIKKQTNQSLDEFMTEQVGMNVAEYKTYMKNQLIAQQFILSQKKDKLQGIAPTDAEIRFFFEMNKASFVQSDILKLFLVVVPKGTDAEASRAKASELLNSISSKKTDPSDLKVKMQAPNAGFQAGDMFVSKNAQAAQQLGIDYTSLIGLFVRDKGFISEINETPTDFQFYMIRDKYDAKMLALSDVVQPDTTVTVYEYIKNQLTQQKQSEALVDAAKEVTESLRKPENYQMLKTGEALDKLLSW